MNQISAEGVLMAPLRHFWQKVKRTKIYITFLIYKMSNNNFYRNFWIFNWPNLHPRTNTQVKFGIIISSFTPAELKVVKVINFGRCLLELHSKLWIHEFIFSKQSFSIASIYRLCIQRDRNGFCIKEPKTIPSLKSKK